MIHLHFPQVKNYLSYGDIDPSFGFVWLLYLSTIVLWFEGTKTPPIWKTPAFSEGWLWWPVAEHPRQSSKASKAIIQGIQGTREGHIMKNPTSVTWKRFLLLVATGLRKWHASTLPFWANIRNLHGRGCFFLYCKQGTVREKKLFTIDNHLNDPECQGGQAVIKADDTRYQSLEYRGIFSHYSDYLHAKRSTSFPAHKKKKRNRRAPEICAEVWYAEASPGMVNSLKNWTLQSCSSQQKSHKQSQISLAQTSNESPLTFRAKIYQTIRTTRYLLGILGWHHDRKQLDGEIGFNYNLLPSCSDAANSTLFEAPLDKSSKMQQELLIKAMISTNGTHDFAAAFACSIVPGNQSQKAAHGKLKPFAATCQNASRPNLRLFRILHALQLCRSASILK